MFLVRAFTGSAISEKLGINLLLYDPIPMKEHTSLTQIGGGMDLLVSSFCGSGFIPSELIINLK